MWSVNCTFPRDAPHMLDTEFFSHERMMFLSMRKLHFKDLWGSPCFYIGVCASVQTYQSIRAFNPVYQAALTQVISNGLRGMHPVTVWAICYCVSSFCSSVLKGTHMHANTNIPTVSCTDAEASLTSAPSLPPQRPAASPTRWMCHLN